MNTDPYIKQVAVDKGWPDNLNAGEYRVALALSRDVFDPADVTCQLRIGPYRVDFFLNSLGVVIESDGWVHGNARQIEHDKRRDRFLRGLGFEVVRVDLEVDDWESRLHPAIEKAVVKGSRGARDMYALLNRRAIQRERDARNAG